MVLLLLPLLAATFGFGDTVEAVRFEGNRAFTGRQLAGVVSARRGDIAIEQRFDADVRAVVELYLHNGFRAAQADWQVRPGRRGLVATFRVVEGTRSRVAAVRFEGNLAWSAERLARVVPSRPGQHVTAVMLAAGEERLTEFYSNNGYPFVTVSGEWEHSDTLATLVFRVEEGLRCHISAVRVRGNRHVASAVVLRTIEVRPGEVFNRKRLQEAQRRLYATRLFQRVLFYVLRSDSTSDSVVVRYDVAEQSQHALALGAGFEALPFRLLGSVDWQHLNMLNRAHVLDIGTEFSPDFAGDYRLGLQATYRVPYVFGNRINFTLHPFFYVERIDTAVTREYGEEAGLSRSLAPNLSVGLFNRFRLVADTASGVTNSLALNLQYDTRDDIFDPGSGFYLRPLAEVAGGLLQGNNDFYRVSGEARWFQRVWPGLVVAARALAGGAFPHGASERIPYYEAFTLGGRNNLRGYPDRSVGPDSTGPQSDGGYRFGPAVLNVSLELRSPYAFGWVGAVGFVDGGEVVSASSGFTTSAFEYSAGAGVRVRTPIGPARVDWGKRLHNAPPGDHGRFYFGLLHAF